LNRSTFSGSSKRASDVTTKWLVGASAWSHARSARDNASSRAVSGNAAKELIPQLIVRTRAGPRTEPEDSALEGLSVLSGCHPDDYGRSVAAQAELTALEASFLAIERPGLPMHVAGVVVFDASSSAGGPLTLRDLRRLVKSRLLRLPKFRERVTPGWLGLLRPQWVEVATLDLDAHLFHHRLGSRGTTLRLTELCAQIHEEPLPRDRPLWQMHLIDGLEAGRQALVVKTHHCMGDGIAGIQIAEALFDTTAPRGKLMNAGVRPLRFADHSGPTVLGLAQALLGVAFTAAGGPLALAGPFNGRVGGERAFATATFPITLIRRLKRRLGGSVDDVLLAVVTAGIARQLSRQRYPEMPPALRAMIPVSTRRSADGSQLGNRVSAVFIDLPLDSTDLPALVRRIAASKSNLRSAHAAAGMSLLIEAAGRLPGPLHEAVVRLASSLPTFNLVMSDVPGPDEPLFILGRRILAAYPMIPLSGSAGLSVAAVSLAGQIGVGIVADPNLVPRPQRLAAEMEAVVRGFERSQLPRASSPRAQGVHRRAA
jgi:diacylglycerol O-acyltransferase